MVIDKKGRIIIIDDQENWRKFLETILLDFGFNITSVSNFEDGKKELLKKKYSLAIIDVRLANNIYNVQGFSLLQLSKSLCPEVKAIILTGYPDEDQKKKALEEIGADYYLEKSPNGNPFDTEIFMEQINKLINS